MLQSELIDLNNIDFIGRFENFDSDLLLIMQKLGIEEIKIEKKNASNTGKDYKEYYDDELIKIAGEKFMEEIKFGNYSFENV